MSNIALKSTELVGNIAATDMSILSLISHADIVVKAVMLMLLIASVWSWAIIFDKYIKFKSITDKSEKFEKIFWSGQMIDQLYDRIKSKTDHPLANVFIAAMEELNKAASSKSLKLDHYNLSSLKERIVVSMQVAKSRDVELMERNISFLALVASNAPFVGLFGTVWGIMHSFQSIAASKNTTLAVVAPGIAEALLATAIGLIAAIPAAIFYNVLISKVNNISDDIEDFSSELHNLLSREIDEGKV